MNWTQLICILFSNNFPIAFILARQFKSETIKMIPKYAHGNWMERIFLEVYVLKLSFSRLIIWLTDRAREVSFLSYSINLLYQERVNWQTKPNQFRLKLLCYGNFFNNLQGQKLLLNFGTQLTCCFCNPSLQIIWVAL